MTIDLVFITYDRLEYTKLSLASVLADPSEQFSLTIWDNASTDGTIDYLRNEVRDTRIKQVVFSPKNVGQIAVLNQVWGDSDADLLGKLDNDCILTPGWSRTLAQAHQDIPELGVIACWHFMPEDFNFEKASHKIQQFGRHRILRHPWTCGTGLLVKRETYERMGPMPGEGTTQYWLGMARAGYVNGFYYPLICQEHMDDFRSKYNRTRWMSFEKAYKTTDSWHRGDVRNYEDWEHMHKRILENLLTGPFEANYYYRPLWKRVWKRAMAALSTSKARP